MPPDIPGISIQATKNADGTWTYLLMRPNGSVFAGFTLLAADNTTIQALTAGNSTTVSYAENSMANLPNMVYNTM